MPAFIFGLHQYALNSSLAARLKKALRRKSIKVVAHELATKPGDHILPRLEGDAEYLKRIRKRYLEMLSTVFSPSELEAALQLELETMQDATRKP